MKKFLLAVAATATIVGTASAADVGYPPPPRPVAPVVPIVMSFSWTGCYLGGFAGGAWGAKNVNVVDAYSNVLGAPSDIWGYSVKSSFIGGGTAGCNWQPIGTPWVMGLEGEAGYLSLSGSAFDPAFPLGHNIVFASAKIGNGYGMVTGRLGYAADRVLLYVKGGAAFLDESVTVAHSAFPNLGIPAATFSASNNGAHFAIGAGIEWAFAGNWTVKAEYMAIGLENVNSPCGFVTGGPVIPAGNYCWGHSGLDAVSTFKVGVNYLFGGGAPVVARY